MYMQFFHLHTKPQQRSWVLVEAQYIQFLYKSVYYLVPGEESTFT